VIPHAWCVGHDTVVIESTWKLPGLPTSEQRSTGRRFCGCSRKTRAEGFPPGGSAPVLPIVLQETQNGPLIQESERAAGQTPNWVGLHYLVCLHEAGNLHGDGQAGPLG
jgi:hypothetical protein